MEFLPWRFSQSDMIALYHPDCMDAGNELNIVDGKFFPAIMVEE